MRARVRFGDVPLFRSRRFADLIERQLDLYANDHADALRGIAAARDASRRASADDDPEQFGDYQDQIDWAAEDLTGLRDTYATTLERDAEAAYRKAFAKAAGRRFPELAPAIRADRAAEEDLGL